MSLQKSISRAFRVGVPLVAVESSDPVETIRKVREGVAELDNAPGVIVWDCVRGVTCSDVDRAAIEAVGSLGVPGSDYMGNLTMLLQDLPRLRPRTVVCVVNAHRFLDNTMVVQAVSNLRDVFKADQKVLVLIGAAKLPPELQHDVISFSDPLPDLDRLKGIVSEVCDWAGVDASPEVVERGGSAVLGVTGFAAENLTALAMDREEGLKIDDLWVSKARKINQTPGLQVVSGSSGYDAIGGCSQIKRFMRAVLHGKAKPNAIVYVDEIEKALGGTGDTSGVSQDQLGQLLSWLQDRRATGAILVGPPGAAKSAIAKASGVEGGVPTIQLDLGATKGSLVGQSEQQVREALKVIDAVSGGSTLWIATCNSLTDLPPELKRRFKLGTWFFDLPDAEERAAIWTIYGERYGVAQADWQALLGLEWTGAEIESCCELSSNLGISVSEAADYIVPVAKHAADAIARLRSGAEGRFLSASFPGPYTRRQVASVGGRRIE